MTHSIERFEDHALGRPYHAALIDLKGRVQTRIHEHRDYYEVMVVVAGSGEHHVRPASRPPHVFALRPRDVVLVRPSDRHAIVGAVQFYNIAFPATAWRAFVALAKVDLAGEHDPLPPHVSVPDDRVDRACAHVLEHFQRTPGELDLIRFWTEVVPLFEATTTAPTQPPGTPDWLTTAVAAMTSEQNLRHGVPRLLALAHVSPAHLARSMRRHYNMTASEFVADVRLRHAATLLATTARPIADIAFSCGYHSASYFTRCFRAAHGVTPRQFRYNARHPFVPY